MLSWAVCCPDLAIRRSSPGSTGRSQSAIPVWEWLGVLATAPRKPTMYWPSAPLPDQVFWRIIAAVSEWRIAMGRIAALFDMDKTLLDTVRASSMRATATARVAWVARN